jgi:periplasmic protein TonB
MTIVSGPPLLQESAKEALRHWKYAPAQLHGKPVPMHMTVTIQFKLQ